MESSVGRVLSVQGRRATVKVDAGAICPRCAEGKGCGAGVFGQGERERAVAAIIPPQLKVEEGELVDVVLEPRNILRASGLVYGVPLLSAVGSAAMGWLLDLSEAGTVVMALLGLAGGLFLARLRLRTEACLREFTPTIAPRA